MGLAFALRQWSTAGNIPTRCLGDQANRCRGPLVHYVPITENGNVVDTKGYTLDPRNVECGHSLFRSSRRITASTSSRRKVTAPVRGELNSGRHRGLNVAVRPLTNFN
jgi:hypothetical protein